MKHFFNLSLILILASCTSSRTKDDVLKMDKTMISDGYRLGIVEYSKKETCGHYFIIDSKDNKSYDPINFDDELFANFKIENQNVYFKFSLLRAPTRCNSVSRIKLIEVKKRN